MAALGVALIALTFVDRKPRTRVWLTAQGRKTFAGHVAYLRELIDGGAAEG
jgi:hypothetical protein